MKKTALFTLLLFSKLTFAQDGVLDMSFGTNGRVMFNQYNIYFNNVDANGKMVYMKGSEISRLNQDGSFDTTFGNAGIISMANLPNTYRYRTLFHNDKVYAFTSNNPVASPNVYTMGRYNSDGSIDTTLGGTGYVTLDLGDIRGGFYPRMSRDNKILIAGNDDTSLGNYNDIIVRRYSLDGVYDPTLSHTAAEIGVNLTRSSTGLPTSDKPVGIYELSTGQVVVPGIATIPVASTNVDYHGGLVFITPNTNNANSISVMMNSYYSVYPTKHSIAVDSNDNIYAITGRSKGESSIAAVVNIIERRNSSGSLIYSHPVSIDLSTKKANFEKIAVQPDGKILLAGVTFTNNTVMSYPELIVARYLDNGDLDTTFGNGGYVLHTINAGSTDHHLSGLFLSPDGSIFICGYDFTSSVVLKYKNSVSLSVKDEKLKSKEVTIYPNPVKDILNLSYDEKISTVSIYNSAGQEVLTQSVNASKGSVNVSGLVSGTYVAKVNVADNTVKTVKIIKQ